MDGWMGKARSVHCSLEEKGAKNATMMTALDKKHSSYAHSGMERVFSSLV